MARTTEQKGAAKQRRSRPRPPGVRGQRGKRCDIHRDGWIVPRNGGCHIRSPLLSTLSCCQRDDPDCQQQAHDLAAALTSALLRYPAQPGGNAGNFWSWVGETLSQKVSPKIGFRCLQCLDWRDLMAAEIEKLQGKWGKKACFKFTAISGTRKFGGATFWHAYIQVSGPAGSVPIDPWPSGGSNVIDYSGISGWTPYPGGTYQIGQPPSPAPAAPSINFSYPLPVGFNPIVGGAGPAPSVSPYFYGQSQPPEGGGYQYGAGVCFKF